MSKKPYLPRLCDAELKLALESSGAVLIEGAKWCGPRPTFNIINWLSIIYKTVRVVSFTPKNNFLTRTKLGYKVSRAW